MNGYESRPLHKIVEDQTMNADEKAYECLAHVGRLGQKDLARTEFLSAAQTFALLSIAHSLVATTTGAGIADEIASRR